MRGRGAALGGISVEPHGHEEVARSNCQAERFTNAERAANSRESADDADCERKKGALAVGHHPALRISSEGGANTKWLGVTSPTVSARMRSQYCRRGTAPLSHFDTRDLVAPRAEAICSCVILWRLRYRRRG